MRSAGASPAPELLLCESGGDNLAANFSSELADFTVYVIDVAGGDKVPRKGGPGITQADVLVVNKVDLAPAVGVRGRERGGAAQPADLGPGVRPPGRAPADAWVLDSLVSDCDSQRP